MDLGDRDLSRSPERDRDQGPDRADSEVHLSVFAGPAIMDVRFSAESRQAMDSLWEILWVVWLNHGTQVNLLRPVLVASACMLCRHHGFYVQERDDMAMVEDEWLHQREMEDAQDEHTATNILAEEEERDLANYWARDWIPSPMYDSD